ncbi:cytoplasmic protein [Parashewanella tropica]|uniref:cytoplasmic protein n=1 Tax=Parashewanella tropica TaxID=2547970 RepID=UPI001059DE6A|nr:cytoplasmic protein [Parashewanella tropica]
MDISGSNVQSAANQQTTNVKVMQMAKQQQKAEGETAMQLIASSAPKAVGNAGHIINTKA